MTQKENIFSLLKDSLIFTLKNSKQLFTLAMIPLLMGVCVLLLPFLAYGLTLTDLNIEEIMRMNVSYSYEGKWGLEGLILLSNVIYTLLTAGWLPQWIRHSVHQPAHVGWGQWHKINVRFFSYNIAIWFIGVCFMLSLYVLHKVSGFFSGIAIVGLGGLVMIVSFTFFVTSLSLSFILPAVALNEKTGFRKSWNQTKGFCVKILLIGIVGNGLGFLLVTSLETGTDRLQYYTGFSPSLLNALKLLPMSFIFMYVIGFTQTGIARLYRQ